MTTTMITLYATADYGHTGQYAARITGRNSKFTFEREFLGSKGGNRNEQTTADVDDPGLYETRDVTRRRGKDDSYYVVLDFGGDAGLRKLRSDKEDAMKIARALDGGRAWDDVVQPVVEQDDDDPRYVYRILSAGEAKKRGAAATLDEAIADCYAILEALPLPQQKKVLTALRKRIAPAAETPAAAPETPSELSRD